MRSLLSHNKELAAQLHIIHQVGNNNTAEYQTFYQQHNVVSAHVFSFYDKIEEYYQRADIVLCRAGAGTLFELLFFEKPAIIIPLQAPTTQHQVANAQEIVRKRPDLFSVIYQRSLAQTTDALELKITTLLSE